VLGFSELVSFGRVTTPGDHTILVDAKESKIEFDFRVLRETFFATRESCVGAVCCADGFVAEERAYLAALNCELLLPLTGKDELLGFFSLGAKQSEEPYSGSDVRLLKSVAG